jgi:hypothetical protein
MLMLIFGFRMEIGLYLFYNEVLIGYGASVLLSHLVCYLLWSFFDGISESDHFIYRDSYLKLHLLALSVIIIPVANGMEYIVFDGFLYSG